MHSARVKDLCHRTFRVLAWFFCGIFSLVCPRSPEVVSVRCRPLPLGRCRLALRAARRLPIDVIFLWRGSVDVAVTLRSLRACGLHPGARYPSSPPSRRAADVASQGWGAPPSRPRHRSALLGCLISANFIYLLELLAIPTRCILDNSHCGSSCTSFIAGGAHAAAVALSSLRGRAPPAHSRPATPSRVETVQSSSSPCSPGTSGSVGSAACS
jgi:hypothetical protein